MSTGLRFTLEVDGLPPDAFAVVSFHLNQSLSSLFSLDLSLVSQQFLSLEFAQVLDKMAYLTIWQGDEVQRRVKGVVTWFELGENDKNQMLYSMKVHPPLWRAGLRQNFRIFQNEDIKSILGTMLQENGVTEWSPLFSEPHPSREFCVQYGETDYDFLCRMAAEEGIFFYEEHAYKSTDQSLVLCDTVRHLPESFEIPWNPNTRTEVSTLCISQFRYSAQIRPSSVVTKDYTFKRPGWAGRFEQEGQHQDYEYDRFGQMTAVHREEGISLYRHYDNRGRLTSVKDAQGRETRYEYNAAGDLTAVITPDGNRSETQYDAWGKAVSTTQGGLTRSMEYDAAGRVISLTNENGSHSDFSYDALDRLVQQGGFDGRTQRYHYDLTGKLTQSEDEGLITLWHYDASDRITHRTVNGDPAEQWQYDEHGWLTTLSHTSEGHRVSVHYGYDDKGRLTGERQTVENPETGELLWHHETGHAYNEQGLANRVTPDSLPPVEWLTYGSGYLAGMKLGGTPLLEFTRDRLHRETVRSFGSMAGSNAAYKLTSTYTPAGQLQSQHLNSLVYDRDYGWNDNGDLVRISGPRQTREYGYSATGRLESVRTLAPDLDIRIPYATDPAGNRLPDPELHPDSTLTVWPDNRIAEDAHYVYRHDEYGRLTEKTDRIPAGVIRTDDERTHHYHYDSQHRLVFYTRIQHGEPLVESRYLYDPLGRRMAKRVWRRERDLTGWMSLSRKPEVTWYGWDGDRLTTVQTDTTRIQTVYEPGSFTPLIRVETENGEREKAQRRSLAETLQQEGSENGHGVVFPAELVRLLDRLEEEIRADRVSSESRAWLAQCGLTVEQLARQVEPEYTPARKVHFYHCDHRGLPLALISEDGNTAWRGEYDEWGNQLNEENPHHLHQPYRLPGQQHDEESGLYYNRHRHYDPLQGRYITPDPIGLRGGWNMYQYPLNPIQVIDPMGLDAIENMTSGGLIYAVSGVPGLIAANSITNSAYQFGYDMDAIVGGAHNGAADAMRHCYLMCRMTKTFGSTIADVIGKNHEAAGDRQGQPAKERIMDLKNNTVGIACGDFSAKCSDACIEKYNTGQLFGLDGIKADNPIKAKQGSSDASNY
ncbi:type VI secretion system tip protein TssI/VgrG [Escherichia coli]|uniref:type VI secretion system tip protein TssI/VgrG n=4 Tax=Escherichia coli TaxID=562 RepID=UPI0023593DEB|nr:type VI secretion system tip protein TssI/VgrG [Escherichia coli]MDC9042571.1 type VI secretion system tip protein TssI/VgrG [Escherichia coli]MDC9065611.1 type VI secretion system tip protein TssI/VgrG [Escherichia coli]MDC9103674.1 type VI secretion system tip protein TssI/VgrG [Escherichia coli]